MRAAGPEAGRVAGHRGPRVGHRRQGLVFDLDELARIGGDARGLGDDEGDRLAAVAHRVDGQRQVRGDGHLEAFRQAELGVGRAGPVRVVGDPPHPVGGCVRPRQHREHPRKRRGTGGVDCTDPGVGVGRAHHERARRPLGRGVIGKPGPDRSAAAGLPPAGAASRSRRCGARFRPSPFSLRTLPRDHRNSAPVRFSRRRGGEKRRMPRLYGASG